MVGSHREKRYTLIVRRDFSRYTGVYSMRHKLNAAEMFKQLLERTRADGVLSLVVIVRCDGGGE